MTRIQEKENKKLKILKTALDLFIRKGYGSTRMSDIAQEAGISVGNIFNHFKSKEDLYETLIKLGLKKMDIEFPTDVSDPISFFRALITDIFTLLTQDHDVAKMFVLMDQALHLDIVSEEMKKSLYQSQALIQASARFLEKGQKSGKIRPGNPLALSMAFFTAIQGIAQHIAVYPDSPIPEPEWILSILISQKNGD